jgi:hypothetical protein
MVTSGASHHKSSSSILNSGGGLLRPANPHIATNGLTYMTRLGLAASHRVPGSEQLDRIQTSDKS